MPGTFIPRQEARAKRLLRRVGELLDIDRPDGTETLNKFGKKDDTDVTYADESDTEYGYRIYPGNQGAEHRTTPGGRVRTDEPLIALQHDTVVQKGDRISFPDGYVYHVTSDPRDAPGYKEVTVELDNTA